MNKRTFLGFLALGLTFGPAFAQVDHSPDQLKRIKFWGRLLTDEEDKAIRGYIKQGQILFVRDNNAEGAIEEYYKALVIAPECAYLYQTIGNFFVALGDYANAKENAQYTLKLSKEKNNQWEIGVANRLLERVAKLKHR